MSLVFSLQRLINMKMYDDRQLYANVEDLVV